MKAIINSKIIGSNEIIEGKTLLFDKTIIDIVSSNNVPEIDIEEVIDAGGKYLSPGFIDIHIHGCKGFDTMDDDRSCINRISQNIASTGVTAFLPTTMTMEFEKIESSIRHISESKKECSGAEILGCHLEGPFISKRYKGAQNDAYIQEPDFARIRDYIDIIKRVTIAPELRGSMDFIKACKANGIAVSIGHSDASYEKAMEAIQNGADSFSHLFNAMSPLHHRNPGAVGAAMDSLASCEIIADNIHLHPATLRIIFKLKGSDNLILITDAMRACLMGEGEYELGGQTVIVRNGEARLASGELAGSVLTMNRAIKNIIYNTGANLVDAIKMAALNPAEALGIASKKGSIRPGKDADMVIFDENIEIYNTFVGGNEVYRRFP